MDDEKIVMNSSLYHAHPHLSKNKYYLHYWLAHTPETFTEAKNFGQKSNIQILSQAKAKITKARRQQLATFQNNFDDISPEAAQEIEEVLLDPTWLKDFSKIFNRAGVPTFSIPSIDVLINGGPQAAVNDAINAYDQVESVLGKIEQEIIQYLNIDVNDVVDYWDYLENYFTDTLRSTNGRAPKRNIGAGYSKWQESVLESILSRNNEAFFKKSNAKYKGKFGKWSADKTKLLAALRIFADGPDAVLQYIKDLTYQEVSLIHSDSSEAKKLTKYQEVWDAFFEKIAKYYQQLHAIAAEAATGTAIEELLKQFKNVNDELENQIRVEKVGTKQLDVNVTTNFAGNKRLFDLVEMKDGKNGSSAWQRATKRTSKSDSRLVIQKDKVIITQGFSVKDYKEYNVNSKLNTATVDIQKGTPLLTLLTREANLKPREMHTLYQLLAVHGTNEDSMNEKTGDFNISILIETWNQMIDTIKYLAFLDAIAGFTNEQDKVLYFVFNGEVYAIWDILDYLQKQNSYKDNIRWGVDSGNSKGLLYETYHNQAEWEGTKYRSKSDLAESRSDEATQKFSQTMYDTKIRIKLHIADFAAFRNMKIR